MNPIETKNPEYIAGAGGGGKGGGGSARTPVEAPDSLRSRQMAKIVDAICEGPIKGLVGGLKGVYLDGTPVQNADLSYNFTGVTVQTTLGTQAQDYLPGFPSVESEIGVGLEVKSATPLVRTVATLSMNAVRVTISIPALTFQSPDNGDISGTSVIIAIDVQNNGAGYVERVLDTISGKCSSPYQRSYYISLPTGGPWDIRVRKVTADSTKTNLKNNVMWYSYTEVVESKLRFPNTALVGLEVDAKQFQSIPRREYLADLMLVKIPSNYNPLTRVYTGSWDGTFSVDWTDNPVWAFYDIATTARYGLGQYVTAAMLDKWYLYSVAQYCDQLVSDGKGGTEPRFRCNIWLQEARDAYALMQYMASIFRAMTYWSGSVLHVVQDKPQSPIYTFTAANVRDGIFNYSGTALRARHTVAIVQWNDPDDAYAQRMEYIEDSEGIALYGEVRTEVVAVGCTSRGQAHRVGKYILLTERLETDSVTFITGLDAQMIYPGAVINIQDPHRAQQRLGGRLVSATLNSLTLDAPVVIASGKTYTAVVLLPDGTIESKTISNAPGTYSTLTFASNFAAVPEAQSVWALSISDLALAAFRVLQVREAEHQQYEVTALQYSSAKYAAVEDSILLEDPPVQPVPLDVQVVPPPLNLTSQLVAVADAAAGTRFHLDVSWQAPLNYPYLLHYFVEYQRPDDNLSELQEVKAPNYRILDVTDGYVTVRVYCVNIKDKMSAVLESSILVSGVSAVPMPTINGLEIAGQGNDTSFGGREVKLQWKLTAAQRTSELGAEPLGASSGGTDPAFRDYEVTVRSAQQQLLRIEHVTDPAYVYTYEKNLEDSSAVLGSAFPQRSVIIGVTYRDRYNRKSAETKITVTNPASPAPSGVQLYSAGSSVQIGYDRPVDIDFFGIVVYSSTSSGFTPSDSNIVYRGSGPVATIPGLSLATHYFRLASEDAFGIGTASVAEYSIVVTSLDVTAQAILTTLTTSLTDPAQVSDGNFIFDVERFAIRKTPRLSRVDIDGSLAVADNVVTGTVDAWKSGRATVSRTTGKWYWEVTVLELNAPGDSITALAIGIAQAAASLSAKIGTAANGWVWETPRATSSPQITTNGSSINYGTAVVEGDVIGVALDLDNATMAFYLNGVAQGTAFAPSGAGTLSSGNFVNAPVYPAYSLRMAGDKLGFNFGASDFAYTAPVGFLSLVSSATSDQFPFIVDSVAGEEVIILNSNVQIGGSLAVTNLRSGALPNDVRFDLGGGIIQLDGAGAIRVYKALGSNQDFVMLTSGDISFQKYISGTGYVEYKHLRRIEGGQAASGATVTLPGYWTARPDIMVSPSLVQNFAVAYAAQDQSIRCQAANVIETSPGTWTFDALATLELSASSGAVGSGATQTGQTSNTLTSTSITMPANTTAVTIHGRVQTKRADSTTGKYFRRQYRLGVERYDTGVWTLTGSLSAWKDFGDQIDTWVTDTIAATMPSGAAWLVRLRTEYQDKDGTQFGTIAAEYAVDTKYANNQPAVSGSKSYGGANVDNITYVSFSGYTGYVGWEIYQINLSWNHTANIYPATKATASFASGYSYTSSIGNTPGAKSFTGTNLNFASLTLNVLYARIQITASPPLGGTYSGDASFSSLPFATIYKRRYNVSTSPNNGQIVDTVDYSLAGAAVLASGSLNWIAVGV